MFNFASGVVQAALTRLGRSPSPTIKLFNISNFQLQTFFSGGDGVNYDTISAI